MHTYKGGTQSAVSFLSHQSCSKGKYHSKFQVFLLLLFLEHFSQQCSFLAFKRVTVLLFLWLFLVFHCPLSQLLWQIWASLLKLACTLFLLHAHPPAMPRSLPSCLASCLSFAKSDLLCFRCCFSYFTWKGAQLLLTSILKEKRPLKTPVLAKLSAPLPFFLPHHKPFCHHHLHQSFTDCAPEQLSWHRLGQ